MTGNGISQEKNDKQRTEHLQLIHRLRKRFEHLGNEARRLRIRDELRKLNIPPSVRERLLSDDL